MTNKKLSSIALTIMLMLSIAAVFTVSPVLAAEPYMAMKPEHIINDTPSVNQTFSFWLNISSTVGFVGYQFYMYWNRTYINATAVSKTPPPSFGFEGGYEFSPGGFDTNTTHGRFINAWMDASLTEITGTYTVARIDFKIIKVPKQPEPDALIVININNDDTFIDDDTGTHISPLYKYDGDVKLKSLKVGLPTIYVDPYETWGVYGTTFTVDVKIKDVEDGHHLWGWEFQMLYNTTLLDTINVTEGQFLKDFEGTPPSGTFFIAKFDGQYDPALINTTYEQEGKIHTACLFYDLWPEGTNHTNPVGGGTLATITFNATYQTIAGVEPPAWCWLDIENKTALSDHEEDFGIEPPGAIPHLSENGLYHAPVKSIGRDIDCWTDPYRKYLAPTYYTQYTGIYPQVNADVYQPQDLVILYASVTYGEDPVQHKLVQFEIRPRDKYTGEDRNVTGFPLYRVVETDEYGIAKLEFRIPWPCDDPYSVMGGWYCYQSVDIACQKVVDELWFEVAWTIWLKGCEVTPDPVNKCTMATVTWWFENHALTPVQVYFTVVLYDHQMVPIGMDAFYKIIPPGVWCHPYLDEDSTTIHIPKWAFKGAPSVPDWPYPAAYVNAYTLRCSECGMPYCPEVSDTFTIS